MLNYSASTNSTLPGFTIFGTLYLKKPSPSSWLILGLLGLTWGFSFLAVEQALKEFQPIQIASVRIFLGALILLIANFFVKKPTIPLTSYKSSILLYFIVGALSNAIPFTLLAWAQTKLSSVFVGISMAFIPLIILPLAHFLIPAEVLTKRKLVGFIIGFIGVLILILPSDILFSGGPSMENLIPKLFCVMATFSYAFGAIVIKRAKPKSQITFSAGALCAATIIMLPISFSISSFQNNLSFYPVVSILFLGFFSTGIATLLLVHLINLEGPSFLSLVNYQVPMWAVIIGSVILHEPLPEEFLLALAIILIGLMVANPIKLTRK